MALGLDADAVEQGEPKIAERHFGLGHDEVLAELDACAAAGDEGGTVVEVVNAADVAAVAEAGVIKQATAIGLLAGFESVDEMG